MKSATWTLCALLLILGTSASAQEREHPASPIAGESEGRLNLVGGAFVSSITVAELCPDTSARQGLACEALVMGLYNGFLYGANTGGFVTCVPADVGADRIVPLFIDFVATEPQAEWVHAGELMGDLLEQQGWGGHRDDACLDPTETTNDDRPGGEDSGSDTGSFAILNADAAAGEQLFSMCSACHSVQEGGPNTLGPNLWGVMDRPVASADGFRYSSALVGYAQTVDGWSAATLGAYLQNPPALVPGTSMRFRGMDELADRSDLTAYLMTLTRD